ncbi:N-acetyl sugar amidotransferase [Oleiphilus messinensis]|uniref:N-acetyl sugar amidotransferase n=1 Tax=Oleiphilus messinensis TaxID=141451 RepID=A0A1Y0II65_9GAMM|nr:N-acetyl sugar amidotransferase [Oleiphilus messinensis]ARU59546.1 N-acetyl sugar amidotransferase [Oleiphilus messinensis]
MNSKFKRGTLEKQLFDLPSEVQFCKKCVMSNQRPRIIFDEEGVCSACRNTAEYKNKIDWAEREKALIELLDQHRKTDGSWDVVVPSSGGKDSAFVAHQLKYKYGMNPLTVTWSPLRYTDIGFKNYQAMCDAGFTNLLCTPNGKIHRKLARLSFEELGDAFHVFVLGQLSYAFHIAVKFGIGLVMFGENGEAEYAGNPAVVDRPYVSSDIWTKIYLKGNKLKDLIQYGIENKDYLCKADINEADLKFYSPPSVEEMEKAGILGKHFFGYYTKWSPQESYYYAAEHTGFQANKERTEGTYTKYASLDDKMDGLHYFMKYIKFGFGRTTDDTSHEVRDGHLSREEAVALVNRYDGEFPSKYFQDFLDYLEITEEHFWDVADSYRLEHVWKKEGDSWALRNKVQ